MNKFLVDPIYVQVDLLLLLWTLGIAANGLWMLFQKKNLKTAVAEFWNSENFLFGNWAESGRKKLGPPLFLALVLLVQFGILVLNSLAKETWPQAVHTLGLLVSHLVGVCFILKIVFSTKYSGRQLAFAWPAYFILRWTFVNNHNLWIMIGILVMFAAKDIPFRRYLKIFLCTGAGEMVVIFAGVAAGALSAGRVVWDDGRVRFSVGYGHPNLLAVYLLALVVMYVCYKGVERLKWYDFAIIAVVFVFCDQIPVSRGSSIALVLLLIGLAVAKLWPALFRQKWVPFAVAALPALGFALSYFAAKFYDPANPIWEKLNNLFTGRIFLASNALHGSPMRIAGQMLSERFYVDNVYVYWWIVGGPVASVIVWGAFCVLLWKLAKNGHTAELICSMMFVAHGIMEQQILWPTVNVLVWLLAGVFYCSKTKEFPAFEQTASAALEKGEQK